MSSGTLVNFNPLGFPSMGFGAQLNMLDCKMSSTMSPAAPVNILSECYIGMWENDMAHPPPTKLESTDILDLIDPSMTSHHDTANGSSPPGCNGRGGGASNGNGGVEPGSTSPTTIIHHTGSGDCVTTRHCPDGGGGGPSPYHSHHSTTSPISSSSPSSSTTSSSQYLTSLPPLSDTYCTTGSDSHLLDGFHPGLVSEASHAFQDGGYDAFISDLSQQPPHPQHHHHHHNHHHHHPQGPHPHLHGGGNGLIPPIDSSGGVLLLDMSHQHHHAQHHLNHNHHHNPGHQPQPLHDGQCSPGCPCGGHPYSLGGEGSFNPNLGMVPSHHSHNPPHHHHHPQQQQQQHPHQQDFAPTWDDLPCESADYSILFRKGESPSISDSVSYTDNDSESKSSGGSLSGINDIIHVSPPKRKVGRPPKKDKKLKRNEKKTGRLWEFIRDLLKNPDYCPSLVKWENHEEGHFRFVNSEKVAQLWGQIKNNPRMTYEKLSRAMRYYYKSHVFEPVLGRRLVYKFGYNATNWKPTNPNFCHPKMFN